MNQRLKRSLQITRSSSHSWRFFRAGGVDQVEIRSGQDLVHLDELDGKLWVALSCPTLGLECAEETLTLIDTDHDGMVRVPELLTAIAWSAKRLKDPDSLLEDGDSLKLDQIDTSTEGGLALVNAAREILRNLGKPDANSISLKETANSSNVFAKARFNGDGVLPPSAAENPEEATAIRDIIACLGGKRDRSTELGVTKESINTFFSQLEEYLDLSGGHDPEAVPAGFHAYRSIRDKLDDYFSRCSLVAFDPSAAGPLDERNETFAQIANQNLSTLPEAVRAMPLAHPRTDLVFRLDHSINPAWKEEVADFVSLIVEPLLGTGEEGVSIDQWEEIKKRFSSKEDQENKREQFAVRKLSADRIHNLLQSGVQAKLLELVKEDEELSDEVAAIDDLHRLACYKCDLHLIARNFVSFADFFSHSTAAIFQAGVLYIDSRSCDLCVRVKDPSAHATLASLSRCFLIYCKCERPEQEPIFIVAILSNGGADDLMIGRHGVFYDRKGQDWHTTVVKIVENPISIREAFLSPYKKVARFIDGFLTKRAEAAEKLITERLTTTVTSVGDPTVKTPGSTKAQKVEVGAVAAIGVALGSIGTFLSMILIRAIELGPWLPFALVGVILTISLPSMLMAALRLKHRTLGPILDATGWAVNAQIKINMPLARFLTQRRSLPPGSTLNRIDVFSGKGRRAWIVTIVVLLIAAGTAFYTHEQDLWEWPTWNMQPPPKIETE